MAVVLSAVLLDVETFKAWHFSGHVWPRLRRQAMRSGTALIVLSSCGVTGSFAALRVAVDKKKGVWRQRTFDGLQTSLTLVRNRYGDTNRREDIRWQSSFAVFRDTRVTLEGE